MKGGCAHYEQFVFRNLSFCELGSNARIGPGHRGAFGTLFHEME
jgi:hypothetical protein